MPIAWADGPAYLLILCAAWSVLAASTLTRSNTP